MKQTLEQILEQDCTDFVKIENIKNLILNSLKENLNQVFDENYNYSIEINDIEYDSNYNGTIVSEYYPCIGKEPFIRVINEHISTILNEI